jgi:hypothetical protein
MRKPLLIAGVVLCVMLFNVLNLTPLLSPLLYTMTPLQRYYASAYLASSWHRNDPTATTETRPIWKTRPDKSAKSKIGKGKAGKDKPEKDEPELATEQDLLPLPAGKLIGALSPEPFRLSDEALAEGWTALRRDNPHEVKSALLADILQQQIFDGYPLRRFFLQPALGLAALILFWFVIRAWRTERWKRNMWNTVGKENLSFLAWSVEVSDRMTKRLLPQPRTPQLAGAISPLPLALPAPASATNVSTSTVQAATERAPKSSEVRSPIVTAPAKKPITIEAVPIPSVTTAKPKPAFVWDESQGID